jgi:hypothetical protein
MLMNVGLVIACSAAAKLLIVGPALLALRALWLLPDWLQKWRRLFERPQVMLVCAACSDPGDAWLRGDTPVGADPRDHHDRDLCSRCGRA